jgi:hypothetical protein
MGQGDLGLNPFEAVSMKLELPEKGGSNGQRVDCGADIVDETGKCQLCGADAAADGFPGLQQQDGFEFSFQRDGRSQPVGPRAHDDGIVMISLKRQCL